MVAVCKDQGICRFDGAFEKTVWRFYKDAAPTALKTGRAGRRETISPFRGRAFGLARC
jgi:hypothetical protein